jgi:hypothetical protein
MTTLTTYSGPQKVSSSPSDELFKATFELLDFSISHYLLQDDELSYKLPFTLLIPPCTLRCEKVTTWKIDKIYGHRKQLVI